MRNVPFEASKKELRELFAAFGQLKTVRSDPHPSPSPSPSPSPNPDPIPILNPNQVRLPKKFDGSHRGFAFVEFVSKQEAAKALAALQSTHLYGRHIVVSYAEQERSVEEMRKKMRKVTLSRTLTPYPHPYPYPYPNPNPNPNPDPNAARS